MASLINNLFRKTSEFFYSTPRVLFINFYKLFTRTKIFNKNRLPVNKSAIFAINHTADADPVVLLTAIKKKICFLAESENFGNWISNFFMRRFANCVPVFKKQLLKNTKSFKELFNVSIDKNTFFGIFPEGEINKKSSFKRFKKGAAYFSYKTGLPIIPVYIHNMNKAPESKRWVWTNRITRGIISLIMNSFRKINIFIGEPIDPVAEYTVENLKDPSKPATYKKIINNINTALEEEFLSLKSYSDGLSGVPEKKDTGEEPATP